MMGDFDTEELSTLMDVFEVKAEIPEDANVEYIQDGHSHTGTNGDQAGECTSHQEEEEGVEMVAEEEDGRSQQGSKE